MAIESKVNNISEPSSQRNFDRLIKAYTLMHTSRQLDHKMLNLIKQGKGFFHIGGAGHEAAQTVVDLPAQFRIAREDLVGALSAQGDFHGPGLPE